jgi:hypothetical protein
MSVPGPLTRRRGHLFVREQRTALFSLGSSSPPCRQRSPIGSVTDSPAIQNAYSLPCLRRVVPHGGRRIGASSRPSRWELLDGRRRTVSTPAIGPRPLAKCRLEAHNLQVAEVRGVKPSTSLYRAACKRLSQEVPHAPPNPGSSPTRPPTNNTERGGHHGCWIECRGGHNCVGKW